MLQTCGSCTEVQAFIFLFFKNILHFFLFVKKRFSEENLFHFSDICSVSPSDFPLCILSWAMKHCYICPLAVITI